MSVKDEEIVEACMELLENVQRHPYGTHERPFLTAYQIWILLQEGGNRICQALENDIGTAVGKGAGENVGPAQSVARALGHSNRIETHYLDTRRIKMVDTKRDIIPSGSDCGLFRLRE